MEARKILFIITIQIMRKKKKQTQENNQRHNIQKKKFLDNKCMN